ncbi:1-phosphatidylinositol 4,5-bisphosphate phosphodiesterase eta-2 isoform X1 [Ixodes scapularis]|uniref:1-phosphatidylinositol 4,5-bisphosphate phosphodiesterase eta-2 isoform X1 n=1 Tax=Ixodes scapularis TaxID=6945 RepID=UPI001A9DB6B8|nr:1-phosphatidylinositol 4,5-bisphosphate phosphodiesterase eta-2 isoform X1 [Ixodes scapularis]
MSSAASQGEEDDERWQSEESATIEDVLQYLSRGMKLHKVRSSKKYYKRRYQLNLDNMLLVYAQSRKPFICSKKTYLDIFDVEEVRKGWKTDVFNDVESKFRRRKSYLPFGSLNMNEDTCFSIVISPKNDTLDLVACNANDCELWVRGLRHLVANCKNTRRDQEYERWLRDQFQKADVNRSGSLNFSECQNLLKQLNVSMDKNHCRALFNAANFKCHKVDGEDVLDREEFIKFYHSLLSRPDIDKIFKTYTAQNMTIMGPEELRRFLTQEQKMNVTLSDCKQIIEKFAKDKNNPEGFLGLPGFRDMLLSDDHNIFDKEHNHVCQDMNQPLNHYYIASSHNTYLVQGQLMGSSSVEGYIRALKKGCRCLELDVWDGPNNEPVVYHGYTLTSKILFRDILDSVKLYAFEDSQYPVILSLENHCSTEQQKVMAKHLVEILGDKLHNKPISDKETAMPPPSALLNKILIKGKKLNKDLSVDADDDSEDESTSKPTSGTLAEELSNIVNYCKASHFKSFEEAEKWHFYEMASFSEGKAAKLSSTDQGARDFVRYNSKHLSRIYPKGTRTDSSNYDPVRYWNVGCQIVALNYQSWDQKMFMNEAKFSMNGRCGYVLMPEFLRKGNFGLEAPDPALKRTLVLKVISGQQLPKPLESTDGEVVDPYVVIKVAGHPMDKAKVKTRFIRNNGFNPQWDETFELPIRVPQLAMVMFTVKDESRMGKNMKLAKFALPFDAVKEGYRHVHLRNNAFLSLVPASIFVHVSIRK